MLKLHLLTPTKFWVYRYRNRPVRLFTMCPGHNFLLACPFLDISHHYPWPKVVSSKSRCTRTKNPCPGHNTSLRSWIWIFHAIFVHDPRSRGTLAQYVSGPQLLAAKLDLDNISHTCWWPKVVSWPEVISLRSRSRYTYWQSVSRPQLAAKLDLGNISHTNCPWP